MNTEQKRLFEETLADDEASLQAHLEQARASHRPRQWMMAKKTSASRVSSLCPIVYAASKPPRARRRELPQPRLRQGDEARG